ncbi:ATP-binding protein [Kineothrix sp. MB12-C1]|uniref:ATP-binding protein n=1 Tax=Kineothrix sp. MB12-C1 TaxID=3070215 RepID=UPI0027D273FE|nr:ATP-binding protein [Kineothrix sp. MB12-C1]WMC94524.1 ATP-binding protein [Kineothrix sp. MB12-C1]
MRENEFIVYKEFGDETLLYDMAWLMTNYNDEYYNQEDKRSLLFDSMHRLLEIAGNHGFYGNLWHCYLANLLVNNENSYSMACEIKGEVQGTINQVALNDIVIFKEFFDYDFTAMMKALDTDVFSLVLSYDSSERESKVYNARICKRICDLAVRLAKSHSPEEMKSTLTEFYKEYGVGKFGLHKSFRVVRDEDGVHIVPILNIAHVHLDDLVGYEMAKKKLIDNTEAFVGGRKANNCLLFGDAGTGKSSSIKAIANEYYGKGLRIIEVYKHQFQDLHDVIAQVKNRNYKFIIYMDDLSFEEFEIEYKYLKAVIEGGLEKKPENVLIYATSNRRHLIKETFADKEGRRDQLHASDTVQEKLSLVYRFGVTIFFCSPDKKEFQEIVRTLAKRHKIEMPEEELLLEANRWELSHGGLSGRTAQQFVDYLLGKAM